MIPGLRYLTKKKIITMSKFIIEKVELSGSSSQNIVEFCKDNNVKPVSCIKTKENNYDAVIFVDLKDATKGFCILIGTSAYAGEPISRDWGVYKNKQGLPRISTTQQAVVEWA